MQLTKILPNICSFSKFILQLRNCHNVCQYSLLMNCIKWMTYCTTRTIVSYKKLLIISIQHTHTKSCFQLINIIFIFFSQFYHTSFSDNGKIFHKNKVIYMLNYLINDILLIKCYHHSWFGFFLFMLYKSKIGLV